MRRLCQVCYVLCQIKSDDVASVPLLAVSVSPFSAVLPFALWCAFVVRRGACEYPAHFGAANYLTVSLGWLGRGRAIGPAWGTQSPECGVGKRNVSRLQAARYACHRFNCGKLTVSSGRIGQRWRASRFPPAREGRARKMGRRLREDLGLSACAGTHVPGSPCLYCSSNSWNPLKR